MKVEEIKSELKKQLKQGYNKHFKCSQFYKNTGLRVCGLCYIEDLKKELNRINKLAGK